MVSEGTTKTLIFSIFFYFNIIFFYKKTIKKGEKNSPFLKKI